MDGRPYRPGPPPGRFNKLVYLLIISAVVVGAVWFAYHPDDLAGYIYKFRPGSPAVYSLTVRLNNQDRTVNAGQFLSFHPRDEISIVRFDSNRWRNHDIRLFSPDFDVELLSEPVKLLDIMGEDAFQEPRQFVIQAKHETDVLAGFYLLAGMTVLDWDARADQSKSLDQKIHYYRLALKVDPVNKLIQNKLAEALVGNENYTEAAELYESMLTADNAEPILNRLLTIYKASGDHKKTVETYHRLIDVSGAKKKTELLNALENLHEKKGELGEAIKAYEALLTLSAVDEHATIYKKIAYLYVKQKKTKQAVKSYESAAKADPKDRNVFINLARLYREQGDRKNYAVNLARAAELAPEDVPTRMELVQAYLDLNKKAEAEQELKSIIKLKSENTNARLLLLELLEEKADTPELINQYEALIKSQPDNNVLRYNLGVIYYDAGEMDKAEEHLLRAAQLAPNDVNTQLYLFEIYRKNDNLENLLETAEILKKLNPDDLTPQKYLFQYYREKGMFNEALDQALRLIELQPEEEILYDYVLTELENREDYEKLTPILMKWTKERPKVIRFRESLAEIQLKKGNVDGALETLRALAELEPENPARLEKILDLQLKGNKTGDAAETMEKILKLKPSDTELMFRLAAVYENTGALVKARETYARILKYDPENAKAEEAHLRLSLKTLQKRVGN